MAPPNYLPGEKILCYHGPLIYEAKCLDNRVENNRNEYLVHYQGWNKNWDEWVPDSRLLKYNEVNLETQKKLQETYKTTKKRKSGAKTPKAKERPPEQERSRSATPNSEPKSKRIKKAVKKDISPEVEPVVDANVNTPSSTPKGDLEEPKIVLTAADFKFDKVTAISKPENAKLILPLILKRWLLDDYDFITRQKKLVNLPAEKSVHDILEDYLKFKLSQDFYKKEEKANGLRKSLNLLESYFNKCVGSFLLYKWERTQYLDLILMHQEAQPSRLFGSHHLLRLLSKTSDVLTQVRASAVESLLNSLEDLIEYLVRNENTLFSFYNYGIAPPEYHRSLL